MKHILFILLILPFIAPAQLQPLPVITKDSVVSPYYYDPGRLWRFHEGDDMAMASPCYDDSKWDSVYSGIRYRTEAKHKSDTFNSIGWFRFSFIADTTLIGMPLSLQITQYGASEIFLDGKRIAKYGSIHGKDSTVYYDPQFLPLIFTIPGTGKHVIAVRYANYNAKLYATRNHRDLAGFRMSIISSVDAISHERFRSTLLSVICAVLFGFFFAFCLAHLFLFFFYRVSAAHLYFSAFCLSIGVCFLMTFINNNTNNPETELLDTFIGFFVLAAGCISFSGFTNGLFGNKKLRFRIFAVSCLIMPFMLYFGAIGFFMAIAQLVFVFTEGVILTVRAIYKKVKGAKIIGTGILFFALFFLSNIIYASFHGGNDTISDTTLGGKIYIVLAAWTIVCLPLFMSLYLAWNFAFINRSLKNQLQRVETLSKQAMEQQLEKKHILEQQNETLEKQVAARTAEVVSQKEKIERQHEELKNEKRKSDDLLLNILPEGIAEELKEKGHSKARLFDDVTVMFTDFVNFTHAGEQMTPDALVNELHDCFKAFDEIISRYSIEKIKTIGDAYLAVCGLPEAIPGHAEKVATAAMEIVQFMKERKLAGHNTFEIRVGIHTGSVVAGIVGVRKFAYDIWGDTVNTAARLEQNSESGKINISQTTFNLISGKFTCTYRGKIQAKNKGEMNMYFINGTQ